MAEIPEHDLSARDRKKLENAKLAITRGNTEYTVELCSELLETQPGCLEVRKLLRRAQRRVSAERKKSFWRLLARLANYCSLLPGYAILKRQPARAMAIGEAALSRDVNNIKALSLVARGANMLELNETEAFCLESVCDRYRENFAKLERYCESLIKAGSTEKALKVAEKLNQLKPGSGQAQEIVKSASVAHSINKGKWADSEEDFRSKLKDKEESDSLERAIRVVVDDGSGELRTRDLIESIHRDPQNVDNYKLLVRIYLRQEKYEDALFWLEKAFALPDGENDAPLRQLRSELRVSRVERELFELKRTSSNDEGLRIRIEKLEAELLELKLEESRKLVDQFPNDYSQRFKYGSYLLESGNVDAGIQQFQISQRSPSLRLKSLVLLGRCFMAKSLHDLALERFQQAVDGINVMDDFKKEVLYLLADCYQKLERPEDAIEQYKAIYSNDIGYRDVAEKIDVFYRNR